MCSEQFDGLLATLTGCVSRDLIDKFAVDFVHFNSKLTRMKVRELLTLAVYMYANSCVFERAACAGHVPRPASVERLAAVLWPVCVLVRACLGLSSLSQRPVPSVD